MAGVHVGRAAPTAGSAMGPVDQGPARGSRWVSNTGWRRKIRALRGVRALGYSVKGLHPLWGRLVPQHRDRVRYSQRRDLGRTGVGNALPCGPTDRRHRDAYGSGKGLGGIGILGRAAENALTRTEGR